MENIIDHQASRASGQQFYRIMAVLLLINNLVGILLNLMLAFFSMFFFGLGLIGFFFVFVYAAWCFTPRRRIPIVPILMIAYNIIIFLFAMEVHDDYPKPFEIFYPAVFPAINIFLCLVLLIRQLLPSSSTTDVPGSKETERLILNITGVFLFVVLAVFFLIFFLII